MPVISALRRLVQEDGEFKDNLGYKARPRLSQKTKKCSKVLVCASQLFLWLFQAVFKATQIKKGKC
jgi:hypothetical protein